MLNQTKSRAKQGEFVDLFEIEDSCCPVKALKGLRKNSEFSKTKREPVFKFNNGKVLTMSLFNATIRNLLSKRFGSLASNYSCHSFRSAIPSLVAKCPDKDAKDLIKNWGRWKSESFKYYTKLLGQQRKEMFIKICNMLNIRHAERARGGRRGHPHPRGQRGHGGRE